MNTKGLHYYSTPMYRQQSTLCGVGGGGEEEKGDRGQEPRGAGGEKSTGGGIHY